MSWLKYCLKNLTGPSSAEKKWLLWDYWHGVKINWCALENIPGPTACIFI